MHNKEVKYIMNEITETKQAPKCTDYRKQMHNFNMLNDRSSITQQATLITNLTP